MRLRAYPRILIQSACGNRRHVKIVEYDRHGRGADFAKRSSEHIGLRKLAPANVIFASHPAKTAHRRERLSRVRGASCLAAHGAVTVRIRYRVSVDFPGDISAQRRSLVHCRCQLKLPHGATLLDVQALRQCPVPETALPSREGFFDPGKGAPERAR